MVLIRLKKKLKNRYILKERFSLSVPRESTNMKWFVGLTYTTEKNNRNFNDVKPTVWLKPNEDFKVIPVPANSGWIIFNLQSTGKLIKLLFSKNNA